MTKVKLPSFIPESNGRIGDAVFYTHRVVPCMRTYVSPVNPDTDWQRLCRSSPGNAPKSWKRLSLTKRRLCSEIC